MKSRAFLLTIVCSVIWQVGAYAQQPSIHLEDRSGPDEPVRIANLRLSGSVRLSHDEQDAMVRDITSREYRGAASTNEVSERLRYALQKRGYFKAQSAVEAADLRLDGHRAALWLVANIESGEQYRVKDITFKNVKAFAPEELRAMFALKSGDVFDTDKVRVGLENVRRA